MSLNTTMFYLSWREREKEANSHCQGDGRKDGWKRRRGKRKLADRGEKEGREERGRRGIMVKGKWGRKKK